MENKFRAPPVLVSLVLELLVCTTRCSLFLKAGGSNSSQQAWLQLTFLLFFFLLLLTFNYFLCREKRKMLLFWSKVWALMNGHNTLIKLWNNEEETGCNAGLVYWSVSSHQYWPTMGSQVPQTINLFRVFLGAWKLHLLDRFKMDFEQFSEIYIH